MAKDFDSLLEYKKSTGDWHYNPSIPSVDCQYVGQIIDLDFESFKNKLPIQSRVVRTTLLFDAPDLAKLIDSKFFKSNYL